MIASVVKTIDGKAVTLSSVALDALRGALRGGVCLPGEPGYEEARTIWNAMIDRRPFVIVRAAGSCDVLRIVRLAAQQGLSLSVRGGPGQRNYWKSHDFVELADGLIDALRSAVRRLPSPQCEIFIGNLGGAINRVPVEATA